MDTPACTVDIFSGDCTITLAGADGVTIGHPRLLVGARIFDLAVTVAEGQTQLVGRIEGRTELHAPWLLLLGSDGDAPVALALKPAWLPASAPADETVLLSICIPTFNRGRRCLEAVQSALACPSPLLEVVVRDNGSEDDTLALLAGVTDPRLRVLPNGRNLGPIRNFNLALASGRGRYGVLHSDEDTFVPEILDQFIAFLAANPGLSCAMTSVAGGMRVADTRVIRAGRDALLRVARPFTYMGGFCFRRADLDMRAVFPEYADEAYLYPFENFLWHCCARGDLGVFAPALVVRGRNEKSHFPRAGGRHFNHPVRVLAQGNYRKQTFARIAAPFLTPDELEKAATGFDRHLLRQNFSFSYELPTGEKFELLAAIFAECPALLGEPAVQALLKQAVAEALRASGRVEAAADLVRSALNDAPDNVIAWCLLVEVLGDPADGSQIDHAVRQVVDRTERRWPFLLRSFQRLIELGHPEAAAELLVLLESAQIRTPVHLLPDIRASMERARTGRTRRDAHAR